MTDHAWLSTEFELHRDRLRGVAYRLLGDLGDADDALQESWIRVSRSDTEIDNIGGWLTTVVSRVCLDMLRSRESRRESDLELAAPVAANGPKADPEQEAIVADAVGVALLVVLDALTPIERTVFVLHEMFAIPFEDIARIVGKSPAAARQIASRARKRVRGASRGNTSDVAAQRRVVDAFVSALRSGDLDALLRVLDPDVVVRADASVAGVASEVRGARTWAEGAVGFTRSLQGKNAVGVLQVALVDGVPGIVLAPRGRLMRVLRFGIAGNHITSIDIIGDATQLAAMTVSVPTTTQ